MANLVESPANITDKRSARKAENRIAIVEAAESLILEGGYGALLSLIHTPSPRD